MNPQDPLAGLQPLREPELINWWPLAPGWWILLCVLLLVLLVLAYILIRRYKRNAYRRHALPQLQSLQSDYQSDGDSGHYLTQLNALLKSVALRAYPAQDVAARHGAAWLSFLNQSAGPGLQFEAVFASAAYQETCPDLDVAQLHKAAEHWIRHHRGTL